MALCRKQSFSPPTELPITGSRVASKRERNLYLIFTLSHLQGDAGRALADGERATLSARAETLHRRAAVGVALRDVELRLVHPHVVLGVGRAREQRVENRFAGSVRHKLEHDQALFVALTANNIENSANLRRRHAHAAQVAHRLLLFGVNLSSSRETHRRRHSRQSLHLSHESHNLSRHHATDHRASTSVPRRARIKQNPPPTPLLFRVSRIHIHPRPPSRARPRARDRDLARANVYFYRISTHLRRRRANRRRLHRARHASRSRERRPARARARREKSRARAAADARARGHGHGRDRRGHCRCRSSVMVRRARARRRRRRRRREHRRRRRGVTRRPTDRPRRPPRPRFPVESDGGFSSTIRVYVS